MAATGTYNEWYGLQNPEDLVWTTTGTDQGNQLGQMPRELFNPNDIGNFGGQDNPIDITQTGYDWQNHSGYSVPQAHSIFGGLNPTLVGGLVGGGVGGLTGATLTGNALTGTPLTNNLARSAGGDIAGLGVGVAAGGALGSGLGLVGKGASTALSSGGGNVANSSGSSGNGLFDYVGNALPAAGAAYLGNKQRQDVIGQVGKINTLGDQLGDQSGAYLRAITDPYDQQTGLGRTSLSNALSQRGVGGSSFGNQQLGNYDYMRGLGRGDLATKATVGLTGIQGSLYGTALSGLNTANQNYNQILGAGLGASGSLFNKSGPNNFGQWGSSLSGLGDSFGNGLTSVGGAYKNFWNPSAGSVGGNIPDGSVDPFTGISANYPDMPIDQFTGMWG